MDYCLIYITCKDEEEANLIASDLIESHFAACANIIPKITSIYKWEGKVCKDSEAILILKTHRDKFSLIENRVKELHSYDCPCIVSWDIDQASWEFLDFIDGHYEEGVA